MDCIICGSSNVAFSQKLAEYKCKECSSIWKPKQFLAVRAAERRGAELAKQFWALGAPIDLKRPALAPKQKEKPPIIDDAQERLNSPTPELVARPAIGAGVDTVPDGATLSSEPNRPDTFLKDSSPIHQALITPIPPRDAITLVQPQHPPVLARPLRVLELFCGKATISKAFQSAGHFSFSVDIRKRKGICEPDLRKDVLDLQADELPKELDIIWASPPCNVWSYAGGALHWDAAGNPKTERAKRDILVLKKTLHLIDELRPAYFFIENPRGRMRNYPELKAWLESKKGTAKNLTLSSYGFPTTKPTNLFTNALSYEPRPMAPFGRGAKCADLSNMTRCSRQATPPELAAELVAVCEKLFQPAPEKVELDLPDRLHGPEPPPHAAPRKVGQTTLTDLCPDAGWPPLYSNPKNAGAGQRALK